MIGTNHFLVGVGIATVLKNPLLAVPVAFASHYVVDMLPHFGLKMGIPNRGKILARSAYIDVPLVLLVFILTLINYPGLYVVAGLAAMSPDFAWVYRFTVQEKFGKLDPQPENRFNSWHVSIQKLEFAWGWTIELVVFIALFSLLYIF